MAAWQYRINSNGGWISALPYLRLLTLGTKGNDPLLCKSPEDNAFFCESNGMTTAQQGTDSDPFNPHDQVTRSLKPVIYFETEFIPLRCAFYSHEMCQKIMYVILP